MIDRKLLVHIRSLVIQLLNALDDALGFPRTLPPKSERREARKIGVLTIYDQSDKIIGNGSASKLSNSAVHFLGTSERCAVFYWSGTTGASQMFKDMYRLWLLREADKGNGGTAAMAAMVPAAVMAAETGAKINQNKVLITWSNARAG